MKFLNIPFVLLPTLAIAQLSPADEALWLRYPAISPDGGTIVFCYQGDLWRVPSSGGNATLLTTHEAYDCNPVWSRDGQWIAFSSDRFGNNDVFVMPAAGGPATRLTFHSAGDIPTDFSPDSKQVLFSSSRLDDRRNQEFPSPGLGELYTVPVAGGRVTRVMPTVAEDAQYSPDGSLIVYHDWKGYEDEFRKHHVSSVTRDIWTFSPVTGRYQQISSFGGEDREPVFSTDGRSVYYLSEEKGSFNVHRMSASGGASTQLTFLKDHPVRHLSTSRDGTLCFNHHGTLYTFKEGGQPQKVTVRIAMDQRYNPERTVSVNGNVRDYDVSSNGKEVAFVHRGEVFVTSVKEGTTRRITNTPEQERDVQFSPDGRTLVYATERNGSWDLYTTTIVRKEEPYFFTATVLKEEPLLATPAEEFQPRWSPDGKEVAYLEERTTVRVYSIAGKASRTVLPADRNYSYSDGDQHFAWSPDSKWLLVNFLNPDQWIDQSGLIKADGSGTVTDLSKSGYGHWSPTWTMDGKAMLTYSSRDGMKNHASWGGQVDAYATFFTQAALDRFKLSKEELELLKEEEDKKKKETEEKKDADKSDKAKGGKDKDKKDEKEKVEPLKIELEHIEDRRVRLTIHSSSLSGAVLSKDGEKLYYLARFEKGFDLWETELRTRETKVAAKMNASWTNGLMLDKEGKNLYFVRDGGIARFDIDKGSVESVGISGEMTLNEAKERAYLFEHVWRQVVKKFYDPKLHGVNWDFYKQEYARVLPQLNNNHDFAELLSEMLGELNASHTGSGYRRREPNSDATASLGLFYDDAYTGSGLKVTEVMQKGPCVKEGTKIKAGVVIEQIDGQVVAHNEDAARLLNRKAGKPTLLSLFDPKGGQRWEETVKPIARWEEGELLYHRWTDRCAFLVDSLSGGRIGYVHVEGMDDPSFRKVYEDALGKHHNKQALVVDTRFNGGGWLHDDLATFLAGKVYMRIEPRGQKLGKEPQFKWYKPSAVVMSESNYSDAHLFPVTYKALGVGQLVGMPVPGTGTAVWWEGLQNGMYFGIPQVGMIDNAGNFMENTQLEPDVRQPLEPALVAQGRDQQLEAAVKLLLEELKR
ncbi:MAG: PD40 domain-containing protein [Flavobacteriales bacterium]|nr:PD40 domain-containing protein [Flavobacteriales bacterium]